MGRFILQSVQVKTYDDKNPSSSLTFSTEPRSRHSLIYRLIVAHYGLRITYIIYMTLVPSLKFMVLFPRFHPATTLCK